MVRRIKESSGRLVRIWMWNLSISTAAAIILFATMDERWEDWFGEASGMVLFAISSLTLIVQCIFTLVSEILTFMKIRDEQILSASGEENVEYRRTLAGMKGKLLIILACYPLFWTGVAPIISIVFKIIFWRQIDELNEFENDGPTIEIIGDEPEKIEGERRRKALENGLPNSNPRSILVSS